MNSESTDIPLGEIAINELKSASRWIMFCSIVGLLAGILFLVFGLISVVDHINSNDIYWSLLYPLLGIIIFITSILLANHAYTIKKFHSSSTNFYFEKTLINYNRFWQMATIGIMLTILVMISLISYVMILGPQTVYE